MSEVGAMPWSEDVGSDDLRWSLAQLPGRLPEATYLVVPNAPQFRLIVDVVADEQRQSLTGVARDRLPSLLAARLPNGLLADIAPLLDARLRQLVLWGTLESWQDEARTDEDFLRNRERFQLTERGAAVNRLALAIERQADATSTTAVLAPPILAHHSVAAADAVAAGHYAEATQALTLVQTTLADMGATASLWQSRLAATIGGVPDESKVARLRQTVTDYVEVWGAGVDVHSASIGKAARRLADSEAGTWRHLALHRTREDAPEEMIAQIAEELRGTVRTLGAWFAGPDSQARRLRRQIRDAVVPLVRSHRTLLSLGGTISRRAELLDLIARIDDAPTDADAWKVWCGSTGLYAARHLGLHAEEVADPAGTSFWTAPPAPVERRLRSSGARALTGRAPLIPDTSTARAAAKARAARDRLRVAAAEQVIASRSGTALSTWPPLDEDQADLLLDLLATARIMPQARGGGPGEDSWQPRVALSRDGPWQARFSPVRPRGSVVLRMPSGRLVVEDCIVEVLS